MWDLICLSNHRLFFSPSLVISVEGWRGSHRFHLGLQLHPCWGLLDLLPFWRRWGRSFLLNGLPFEHVPSELLIKVILLLALG